MATAAFNPIRTVGLTGGIGSGKSEVARVLRGLGAHVVDTDAISRQLTGPGGGAIEAVRAAFGTDYITVDDALDRERMRALVFADPQQRARLEGILHPLIATQTEREAALAQPGQVVVFDVPLLVESRRWRARVDRVLVVECAPETQIDRVMKRSGWTRAMVERVIAQQASREARRAVADAVVLNDGITLSQLEGEVRRIWRDWGLSL